MTRARIAGGLLALTIGACGDGGGSAVTTASSPRTVAVRAPVSILAPRGASAATMRGGRLRAVVRVTGRAAPGQQLGVRAACTSAACEAIAFSDALGRWRVRLVVRTVSGAGRIGLTAAYASPGPGERPARSILRLRARRARPGVRAPEAEGGGATTTLRADAGPRFVLVIGDSLAVGMAAALRADLAGDSVSIDARVSRTLAAGMAVLAATPVPAARQPVLAFSLFTNDDPSAVSSLEAAVRASLARAGSRGCAVWATIRRPPLHGVSYAAANTLLQALATHPGVNGRLLVVPWAQASALHPAWLAPDGVHAAPAGYAARARLYADAIRSCVA